MKVHLIKKLTLIRYAESNAKFRSVVRYWLTMVRNAEWKKPADILQTFGSADLLGNGSSRVVFDLGGNHCRMICHYVFGEKQVHLFVCWIGTHAEYDKLCKEQSQYSINNY